MTQIRFAAFLLFFFFIPNQLQASLPTEVDGAPVPSLAPMLEKVSPAVVNIATATMIETPFSRLFAQNRKRQTNSLGSGVIINASKGLVITNHHVISGADEIKISLIDGSEYTAVLVGSDEKTDIAVLKINAPNLTEIILGDSDSLRVGDFVVALGNPFNLGHSVTSGIVSAKERSGLDIEQYEDFIQTDAAINPGNSGGALVDLKGRLVGINTAIYGPVGNIGIGFAIPINLAKTIVQHLQDYGEVRRGLLGITVQELTPSLAKAFNVKSHYGVVVSDVSESSTAANAGIKTTDILLSINRRKLKTPRDLLNQEGLLPAGSELEIELIRDGRKQTIKTTLNASKLILKAGETFHPLLASVILGEKTGVPSHQVGVIVQEVKRRSRAAYFGLQKGDIIQGIGRYRVTGFESMSQLIPPPRNAIPLLILRDGEQFLMIIR